MASAESRRDEKRQRLLRDNQLRAVLATEAGQDTIWRILSLAGVFSDDFATDSRLHARNSGRRSVGLDLMREVQRVAPQAWLELTQRRINAEMRELATRTAAEPVDDDDSSETSTP